jgi:hypothetical protein
MTGLRFALDAVLLVQTWIIVRLADALCIQTDSAEAQKMERKTLLTIERKAMVKDYQGFSWIAGETGMSKASTMTCCVCKAHHSKKWMRCVYDDGSKQDFCDTCHTDGLKKGYSYMNDLPYHAPPKNKLTDDELQARASAPKPHHTDRKSYKAWMDARIRLGMDTYTPSMDKPNVYRRQKRIMEALQAVKKV